MRKIEEALWGDYESASEKLKTLEVKSEEYAALLDEKDRIRKELLEYEKIESESLMKNEQMIFDNRQSKLHEYINVGTFVASLVLSGVTIWKVFKFDETSTVTSTVGRNVLNGAIPKLFKR